MDRSNIHMGQWQFHNINFISVLSSCSNWIVIADYLKIYIMHIKSLVNFVDFIISFKNCWCGVVASAMIVLMVLAMLHDCIKMHGILLIINCIACNTMLDIWKYIKNSGVWSCHSLRQKELTGTQDTLHLESLHVYPYDQKKRGKLKIIYEFQTSAYLLLCDYKSTLL